MEIQFLYPPCDSGAVPLDVIINISFISQTNTLNTNSIVVTIDGKVATVGETLQCGFKGGLYSDGYGGVNDQYDLSIGPLTSFSAERTIIVAAYALDGEGPALETCSFTTACSDCLRDTDIVGMSGGVYEIDSEGNIDLLWDSSTTPVKIISDDVNDAYMRRTNNNTYVAVATDDGVSLVKNCISSLCYGGGVVDGYEDCLNTVGEVVDGYGNIIDGYYCNSFQADEVYIDELAKLYILNTTENRVEVFYAIDEDLVGRDNPDVVYSTATIPELIGLTINTMHVAEYISSNAGSNVLFLGTEGGFIRIDMDESVPGVSESNRNVETYGIVASGEDYEIIGGTANNVVAITYDHETYLLAIATEDPVTFDGGVTIIDTRVNAQVNYTDGVIDVTDLSFTTSNIFQV